MKKKIILIILLFATSKQVISQNFATVTQGHYITPDYFGKEFRYSAYVKMDKKVEGSGHLWFRVDRLDTIMGFFENMDSKPIKKSEWTLYEISGKIDSNAKSIYFGCFLAGKGKLWVDDFKLEIKDSTGQYKLFPINNPGFEEMINDYAKGWAANTDDYYYINDSIKPYQGKFSMCIESKPDELFILPVFVKNGPVIKLPVPKYTGTVSVETALFLRRSVREYDTDSISLQDVSQMLWAAYGVTDTTTYYGISLRTAPSAGACYPLEIYLVAGKVKGLKTGFYKYNPITHSLKLLIDGDVRPQLSTAALGQTFIKKAPASIFWTAIYEKTSKKYDNRGRERYVCMDLGHSGENVYLQAEAMNFGTCAVAAFNDEAVIKLFDLPKEELPLYIMPFGKLTKPELEKRKEKIKK
jgi:SagB-type dehydrogenase family enzyme